MVAQRTSIWCVHNRSFYPSEICGRFWLFGRLNADRQPSLPQALLVKFRKLLVTALDDRLTPCMGLVHNPRSPPDSDAGNHSSQKTSTRGIELFQSLCRITCHGGSVRSVLSVLVTFARLFFVALMLRHFGTSPKILLTPQTVYLC